MENCMPHESVPKGNNEKDLFLFYRSDLGKRNPIRPIPTYFAADEIAASEWMILKEEEIQWADGVAIQK